MSKDGEFLASSGAGFGPSPTTAILETQVGVPTSSESDVFPSVVQDRVPPRGPGTTVDTDSTLSRGRQGSLAPSLPVSVSADSAIPTPGGSRGIPVRPPGGPIDIPPLRRFARLQMCCQEDRLTWSALMNLLATSQTLLGLEGSVPLRPQVGVPAETLPLMSVPLLQG